MILSKNEIKENISKISANNNNYLVVDLENFKSYDNVIKYKYSLEMLNLINEISWANDFLKKSHSKEFINTKILYKVIDSNLTEIPLSENDLKIYYSTVLDIHNFYSSIKSFKEREIYTDFNLDLILIGATHKYLFELEKSEHSKLIDLYQGLYMDLLESKLSINNFLIELKKILNQGQ